jgi:hypothetical protein
MRYKNGLIFVVGTISGITGTLYYIQQSLQREIDNKFGKLNKTEKT